MAINRQWHQAHRLRPGATLDERITWHLAHAVACGCRDIPVSIKRELENRRGAARLDASQK